MPKRLLIAVFLIMFSAKVYAAEEKNVILISIDTLRADHLGCYGYLRDTSPTIDALAREGTLFLNAFSHSPKTTQSHMSMMTSLHHEVHKVSTWENGNWTRRLGDAIPTLAEILKTNGYATAAFTGGSNVDGSLGFDRGFDIYSNNGTISEALSWLDKNHNKKFFIFFHTYAVHDPYLPPKSYSRMYYPEYNGKIYDSEEKICGGINRDCQGKNKKFWKSVDTKNIDDINFLVAQYDAAIHFVDNEMIRPLLNKLKEFNIYADTLIIFTSDHGEGFKEHDVFLHNDLYAEILHVPIIMVNAKVIPKDKKIMQLARLTDIMLTIFDILGIKVDIVSQGKSLLPAIRGENLNLSCYSKFTFKKSLRTERYSYIIEKILMWSRRYLYDIRKDPRETHNLITNNTKLANKLNCQMLQEADECERLKKRFHSLNKVFVNTETQQKLEALGYLQ